MGDYIVERMQTAIDRLTQEGTRWLTIDALKDGATEIKRLQAEIERLRTELDAERAIADKLAFDFRRHLAWYGTKETHKSLAAHKEARRG